MKKPTKIYTAEMPAISKEYALAIDKVFPKLIIKPGVTQDEMLYNAGQRNVIDYILNTSIHREVSGDPSILRDDNPKSLLSKIVDTMNPIKR